MRAPSLQEIARALGGKVEGHWVRVPGPGHSAKDRSLSVRLTDDRSDIFVTSFAGDDAIACKDYVRARVGMQQWQPGNGHANEKSRSPSSSNAKRRKDQEYIYRNADGRPYLRVDRYKPKSSFPQYHWTGSKWAKGKPSGPKIPYRLPELLEAVHDTVFICEGEKDADALAQRSFVATTASEGAGKWTPDLNPYLEGKTVYVLPDNDEAGAKHAEQVARNLYGIAREVRIVNLPGLPAGGDVSDWLAAGGDNLLDICRDAPTWAPQPDAEPDVEADRVRLHWHGEPDDTPLREWLVEQTLPKRGTALISGQWGTFKTFVALDLAASVMTRSSFAGRAVNRQGGVLFVAVEGHDEVRVRLAALIQEKVRAEAVKGAVAVNPSAMPFVWIETCPKLTASDALPKLRKIIAAAAKGMKERFGLPLVAMEIDTLSPAADFKDANDTAENQKVMTVLKTIAREFDMCVLAVDHFGKDISTGTRNSSVKESDVDSVLVLLGERDLSGNVNNPRMGIRKVRGAPTGAEIRFDKRVVHVEDQGQTFSTLVIDWCNGSEAEPEKPKASPWSKSLQVFKRAFDVSITNFGTKLWPFLDGPEVRAVDREKVRDEFIKTYPGDTQKSKRDAFLRCEKQAAERSILVVREVEKVTWFWLAKDETP